MKGLQFLSVSFLLWGLPVLGADLRRQAGCSADNCLRELQHTSLLASPFCSSFLGAALTPIVTVTVTTTAYTTTKSAFKDSSITELGKRASTSWYPSSCTEIVTAIASGCSCLLGVTTTTTATTATVTATTTATLPPQCQASNNYGAIANGFGIYDGPGEANHYYDFSVSKRGACCGLCYDTPSCIAFFELDYIGGTIGCYIWELYESEATNTANLACPLGTVTVEYGPASTTSAGLQGFGPCAMPTPTP